ncbi:type II secretion system F family protein [Bordetella petrii]|uniref:type II secretion system F family protein n=1 Tax=Bordetella petrii TaxID=94624 RepID=UPI001E572174|nr:type II secretion system F family protein [Bordetella petrii]MCD0501642.1 type II secretion system F family protein [Bordetella petrii]
MLHLISILLAGMGGAVAAWLLARPALADETRSGDAMPWRWRVAWPWLSAVAHVCGPLLSWKMRGRLDRLVTQAGFPPTATAAHAAALVINAAALGGVLAAGLAWWLDAAAAIALAVPLGAVAAGGWPALWVRQRIRRRRLCIGRELPFMLDMMTLCVESGLSLHGALQQAEQHGPPGPLRQELGRALADMRTGLPRAAALLALADRADNPTVRAWVAALIQADGLGMSLGPLLRGQAAQCRTDRFQRAEKLAMEAPVKMLLPLIGCIFPCTFVVLAFPIGVQLWQATQ